MMQFHVMLEEIVDYEEVTYGRFWNDCFTTQMMGLRLIFAKFSNLLQALPIEHGNAAIAFFDVAAGC